MNAGRWYPTSTTLANGDVLVTSGSMDTNYTNNTLPQVYQVATNTWRNLSTAQLNLPLYPFMFVAPNGRVFNAGPAQMSRYLDTAGTGAWTNVANNTFGYRDYGSAVMYEPGKVLIVGGGGGIDTGPAPTATAEVIDLNAATPTWRQVSVRCPTGRRQHNATLLPDGTVLVTGGSNAPGFNNQAGAVHTAELWNPATETWTTLASSTQYRGYHSTALLLPDGRVLVLRRRQPRQRGGLLAAVPVQGGPADGHRGPDRRRLRPVVLDRDAGRRRASARSRWSGCRR